MTTSRSEPRALRSAVLASDPAIVEPAQSLLARGSALDAVIAAVFAASAGSPSVLLGPVQLLVGGAGTGLHALDGRVQQPGRGLGRPRGFTPDAEIPDAARVGTPLLPATLATALASFGKSTLARVMGPAIDIAKAASPPRAALLRRLADLGPRAFGDPRAGGEVLAAAGRGRGGLLSQEDLEAARPSVVKAEATRLSKARSIATVPWGSAAVRDAEIAEWPDGSGVRVVVAADAHGQLAVACYEVHARGLLVEALDLVAPLLAEPVLRGKTRVRPGAPCAAPGPIAIGEAAGVVDLVAGGSSSRDAEKTLGSWLVASLVPEASESWGLVSAPAGIYAIARRGRGVLAISQ